MTTAEAPVVDEVAGAARLVAGLVDALSVPVQQTHRGIAGRVFGTLGPVAVPVRVGHDAIAGLTYGSVRIGARAAGGLAAALVGLTSGGRERRPLSARPRGALALAFFDGLLGDWLDGRAAALVVRPTLTVRPGGAVTDRVVVFVHGLAETPVTWGWWADGSLPYGERLAEVGWTAVDVAYGTGRPVVDSGAELSRLLDDLVTDWPTPLAEVALVGHSMGGLVVGAACTTGLDGGAAWTERVGHVVSLGTPHTGSWLAQAAHRGAASARRLPETRGLGTILDLRSAGIRDLTRGGGLAGVAERMPWARHAFVSGGLGAPFDRLVGDGLVHASSATAPATAASGAVNVVVRHHPGVGHLRLVNHPAVGDDLVAWLGPARSAPRLGQDPAR